MRNTGIIRIGAHVLLGSRVSSASGGGGGGGGGGGSAPSATTLRMSHLSAGRPYVTFLAPAETNADGLRRLHIKTFADSAS